MGQVYRLGALLAACSGDRCQARTLAPGHGWGFNTWRRPLGYGTIGPVQPREAGIRFWLDPIPPEEMPVLAARMLADGHDSPALRRAAACSRRDDPGDARQEFGQALDELGACLPDRGAAELAAGTCLAGALLSGALTIAECSSRVLGIWDFDAVIYPGLPDDLRDLALMCHLLGTEHYAPRGGDERLLAAARALARGG